MVVFCQLESVDDKKKDRMPKRYAKKGVNIKVKKYMKPHPCILFTLEYNYGAKRCKDTFTFTFISSQLCNKGVPHLEICMFHDYGV